MTTDTFHKDHWLVVEPERLERYETLFQWSSASAPLFAPAGIGPGMVVADFGSGLGHTAIEFAQWVGPEGHVHALDISPEFSARARAHVAAAGLSDRVSVHLLEGDRMPLADGALDRIVTRNTLIYVDDPLATLRDFRRVLKPGGKAHAIEGDWALMAWEPLTAADWTALVDAAGHAFRTADIGRKLHGLMRAAGFAEIAVEVRTRPDTTGRLKPMFDNMIYYARQGGRLSEQRIAAFVATVESAIEDGRHLAVAPQFLVTGTA